MKLLTIYKQNKKLYLTAIILVLLPQLMNCVFPHLSFLMIFLSLCGLCTFIYGLLLYFSRSNYKSISTISNILRIAALVLVVLFILSMIVIQYKIFSSIDSKLNECDYALVLGGGIRGKEPTLALKYRLDKAIEYLNKYTECKAVLCGGIGAKTKISEASVMQNYMLKNGISSDRLLLEEKSADTTQNIRFAKEIINDINENDDLRVAIITSDFHIYRAEMIARKAGFTNVFGISAKTPDVPFMKLSLHLREYFSILLEYMNL